VLYPPLLRGMNPNALPENRSVPLTVNCDIVFKRFSRLPSTFLLPIECKRCSIGAEENARWLPLQSRSTNRKLQYFGLTSRRGLRLDGGVPWGDSPSLYCSLRVKSRNQLMPRRACRR
jgi:hypothetical protein